MSTNIKDLLAKSDAATSLSIEGAVTASMMKHDWTVTQGAIYTDLKEAKLREIDVLARRVWRTKAEKRKTVFVVFVVECKTMRGYHLLFNGPSNPFLGFQSVGLAHWIGYSVRKHTAQIRSLLSERDYDRQEVVEVLKRLDKTAFPSYMARVRGLLIQPPPVNSFTAFRETNIGIDKELDNSVLWRAVSALDSCTSSLLADRMDGFFSELDTSIEQHEREGAHKIRAFQWSFDHESRFVWLFHPVVVTDARLWSVVSGVPTELATARYLRSDGIHGINKWFDVVQRDHFDTYAQAVTSYYNKSFRRRRAYGDAE